MSGFNRVNDVMNVTVTHARPRGKQSIWIFRLTDCYTALPHSLEAERTTRRVYSINTTPNIALCLATRIAWEHTNVWKLCGKHGQYYGALKDQANTGCIHRFSKPKMIHCLLLAAVCGVQLINSMSEPQDQVLDSIRQLDLMLRRCHFGPAAAEECVGQSANINRDHGELLQQQYNAGK